MVKYGFIIMEIHKLFFDETVKCFGSLIPLNKTVTINEFIELIEANYIRTSRIDLAIEVLQEQEGTITRENNKYKINLGVLN